MISLSVIQAPVKSDLKKFYFEFSKILKTNVPLLNIITSYILKKKEKQIRPIMVFLSAKMLGKISKSTFTAASLIELLHTATLIHDDVVDNSYKRRKIFSINVLWKSKIAVLFGDFLLAKGLLLAVKNKEYDILNIASDAVRKMSEGELIQIQKSRKLNLTEEEYLKTISKKNAALISSCTISGARSVTDDPFLIEKMKAFGINIGIAFHIKDDLFDYEINSLTGKPKGYNIQRKKLTLPLIAAISNAPNNKKQVIINFINNKLPGQDAYKTIVEFVHDYNGISYANDKMLKYRDEAIKILHSFEENDSRKSLELLVNYIIERKY
jgi:octaprenyl-diphosphate synthase